MKLRTWQTLALTHCTAFFYQTKHLQVLTLRKLLNNCHSVSTHISPFLLGFIFIGPESDHWECLSVTDLLTNCRLVNLIDVTLACEEAYSKFVEVVTVAHVDAEDHVGNGLLQIWELTFGPKAKLLFRL